MLPNSCTQVLMSLVDKENVRNSILGSIPVHELTDSISRCNSIYKNLSYMGLDHSEVSSIASYNLSFLITPIEN